MASSSPCSAAASKPAIPASAVPTFKAPIALSNPLIFSVVPFALIKFENAGLILLNKPLYPPNPAGWPKAIGAK